MNRRATLMMVVGGVLGIVSPSARASAQLHKKQGGRANSVTTADQARGARDKKTGSAPQLQNLKDVGPERQVTDIHYRQGGYKVATVDGRTIEFLQTNLRFKIDSSDSGPLSGKPVILPAGMMGDRALVLFASPAEMGALFKHQH